MPVLVTQHVDKDSRLIATSLLDMPNINNGSTAQQMYDVCNEVKEAFSLDWDNCIKYSSDNTNSMIGQHNFLLQKIQKRFLTLVALAIKYIFCAGKGGKEFPVNIEGFVIDIYYHFHRSAKRKSQLREFMNHDMNATELEFLEYRATPDDEFTVYFDKDDKPVCIDHIWHQISKQIHLYILWSNSF